jgi:ABC-type multidrug transport system fused ATPase/permease subunit
VITFFRRALPLLRPLARRKFYLALVLMLLLAILEAAALVAIAPLMQILTATGMQSNSRLVVDLGNLLGNPTPGRLALDLGIATIVLYFVKSILAILTFRWAMGFSLEEEANLCGKLMRLYLHAPYREHLRTNSSEHIRTLTSAIRMIYQTGFVAGFSAIGDSFSVVFVGLILLIAGPVLAITAILYFAVVAVTYQRVVNRAVTKRAEKLHVDQAIDFRTVYQALTAVKEIKVRGTEDVYAGEVHDLRQGLVPAYRAMALVTMTPRYVLELAMVGAAASVAGVAYSTEPVTTATASVGLFVVGGFRILAPLNKIIFGNAQAKSALPSLDQVISDLDTLQSSEIQGVQTELPSDFTATRDLPALPTGAAAHTNGHSNGHAGSSTNGHVNGHVSADGSTGIAPAVFSPLADTSGLLVPRIALEHVYFSYSPEAPVLYDLTFAIEPGESIGLVGGSGAGKSTLVDILLGLLEPDSGDILIGDRRLEEIRRDWNRMIGYVPQSIALFDDTVRANVAFGLRDNIDDREIWRSLQLAQLADVVAALPAGLDTLVGEAGTRLSGGQRQRLGVARALYRRPEVLMFDEATSALDNETEFKLTEVLESIRGSVTTITIAHRLSTVRRCDRVLYLEQGRLVASGTFDELTDSIPGFARLVELSALAAT